MNYAKNKKYLEGNDVCYYTGLCLVILGVLLFMIGEMMWLYIIPYQYFVATFLAIIGGLLISVPSAWSAREEEIDAEIKAKVDALSSRAVATLPKSKKQPSESPTVVGNFIFDRDDVISRKGRKDGKYRSSLYSAAVILYKTDSILIYQSTFSLTSDVTSENVYDIPFSNIPKAWIDEKDILLSDRKTKLKIKDLHISDNEGAHIIIPVINSVLIDEICERLNSEVKRF